MPAGACGSRRVGTGGRRGLVAHPLPPWRPESGHAMKRGQDHRDLRRPGMAPPAGQLHPPRKPAFMRLVIEYVGRGRRACRPSPWPTTTSRQATRCAIRRWSSRSTGRMGRSPGRRAHGEPVSYRQDNLDIYHEAIFVDRRGATDDASEDRAYPGSLRSGWDRNIAEQGFFKAARAVGASHGGPARERVARR
jgi:hypothetical protein